MNKIYFYGGAFNPMTVSHLKIIENIFQEMSKDDLLVIGITDHDYKIFEFDYSLRFSIVFENLNAIKDKKNFKILKQNQRTWKFLNDNFKNNKIKLVIGQDEYEDLKAGKWHYYNEILNTYEIIMIPRTDGISSSKVRELIKEKDFKQLKIYISKNTFEILNDEGFIQ